MEFLKLYDEENRDILYSMSWLNKNSIFDKSTGGFEEIDLFTFLENINKFDYEKDIFYDDIYYILEFTKDSILNLINNINKETKREHKILPISQAREFDKKTIMWLSRQDGRTIREKLKNNKIKTVKRYENVDTYENRVFKIFLKKLILVDEARCEIQSNDHLISKIRQWLRSDDAKNINEYGNIVYNNILLHHPHYSKVFKSYKWLNRLDEKVERYQDLYPKQIIDILTFSILEKLQFKTTKLILPNNLEIKHDEFNISFNEEFLPEKIDLASNITKLRIKTIDEVNFHNIINLEQNIIDEQLNLELDKDRAFNIIQDDFKEVFIDLFRLFPIVKLGKDIINFPVMLKQQIDNKIVNGNNAKIIDLNNEVYALPEILKTFDTDILRYFLEDFKKYFKDQQLNYIIPDYVNIFEFSQVKKQINSYFKNNRSIPKSILAGMQYLFDKNINVDDTLIYIQKNHNNELFITPLLVKYDMKLEGITNSLYIERHPTKKLEDSNDVLTSLTNIFPKDISQKLLNKFLQNGLKNLKKEKIVFYHNKNILKLNDFDIPESKHNNSSIDKIKKLYTTNNLFMKKTIFINDDKEENLKTYEKILGYESDGLTLWKEHLPDLSMEIIRDGYFDEFTLVDGKTQILDKKIEIKEHFTIPKGISELSFPLVFDNKKIGYIADLKSKDFPFSVDIDCTLQLIYDYESEELYTLTFLPSIDKLSTIKVKWQKEKVKSYEHLIYPEYPADINLENSIEDEIIKEFKQLEKDFKAVKGNRFYDGSNFFLKSSYKKALFSKYWQNGNSIVKSQNSELKQLIRDNLDIFINCQKEIPYVLKNNIYLFLSYIHQDLIINKKNIFILNEFKSRNHLYGLSLGCVSTDWQKYIFNEISKLENLKQVKILNIALWRCASVIEKISTENFKSLLDFIENKLRYSENENDIITYLEFLLASLRTKHSRDVNFLHPNERITKELLNILKSRSKYFVNNYELKSKISFGKINKPDNLQKMPDLLYAVIYYLSNEDIENNIIINEVKS